MNPEWEAIDNFPVNPKSDVCIKCKQWFVLADFRAFAPFWEGDLIRKVNSFCPACIFEMIEKAKKGD